VDSFEHEQRIKMAEDLQTEVVAIVQQNFVDTFGYNTLVISKDAVYSLVSLM